jgi:isopenicillin N synthase-like dioxygenase
MIPSIEISALYGPASAAREAADRAIMAAAAGIGFMSVTGMNGHVPIGRPDRSRLLAIFDLPDAAKAKLLRRKFDQSRPNVYRGWFPLQAGGGTYKEGIDMGPDLAHATAVRRDGDPLLEPTPLPPEDALPGWRDAAATYYRSMEELGRLLMHAIGRGLGLPETAFDAAFENGVSTLRLIHYPERMESSFAGAKQCDIWVEHEGRRRYVTGAPHVDSGFVTVLAQDGVEGLQARVGNGAWVDVPPSEGTLAINFGKLLDRWTGGRIRATEHRVLGAGRERYSIPFFYEPAADAVIAPLTIPGVEPFAPFAYGDHVWAAMMRFTEFQGLETLRRPTGVRGWSGLTTGARQDGGSIS